MLGALLATAAPAKAQTAMGSGFQLNRYEPTAAGEWSFWVDHPWYSSTRYFAAGVTMNYAHNPLVFGTIGADGSFNRTNVVIAHQLLGHIDLAGSFLDRFLITLSMAVFLQSITMMVAVVLASFVYLGITLPREERRLVEIHGDGYRNYMKRVPRFWPNWSLYYAPPVLELRLTGLAAEIRRAVRWIWIPFISLLIVRLRAEDWWPHWVSLW